MDEFLFSEHLRSLQSIPEPVKYLEILNYQDTSRNSAEHNILNPEDFDDFLTRKLSPPFFFFFFSGVFFSETSQNQHQKQNTRYQQDVADQRTFDLDVVSLPVKAYESLVRKLRLPLRALEAAAAVGPFFWWTCDGDDDDEMIFRKSDVSWRGTPRGWEMMLSHSFRTRVTSGYVKGTASAEVGDLLRQLSACARPAAHPLALPILVLSLSFSPRNDLAQRRARERLRQIERGLSRRYTVDAAAGYEEPEPDEVKVDVASRRLTDCQCEVLQKRPQAWRNVVVRAGAAMARFWEVVERGGGRGRGRGEGEEALRALHSELLSRLDFLMVKLEGLENYTHVSLERLNMQREVMHSIINQRESRLSLRIAAEQHRLADASKRDSSSMKTLTFLGSIFLPGTFVSSLFSMSFFDFSGDITGQVSKSLWLYFAITVPLTLLIVGGWWQLDRILGTKEPADNHGEEMDMEKLEDTIMQGIRKRTGLIGYSGPNSQLAQR
ncbi:hypothetical protein F4775DRAFT_585507 [Biscogniauxia sp. FL1348]|nr:hypothetical protein F4775DRAFT_585507 [Biscogniauxia sp. FL1348]